MTNNYNLDFLQNHLDEIKYCRSQEAECDLSGKMDYCEDCEFKQWDDTVRDYYCILSQSDRSNNCFCAKNYLKIKGES